MVTEEDVLLNFFNKFGPLVCTSAKSDRSLSAEDTLAWALKFVHRNGALTRVWPVAFARNRAGLDLDQLARKAAELEEGQTFGFLLSVSAKLMNDEGLKEYALRFKKDCAEPARFFPAPRCQRLLDLEKKRTPELAREWGFWMNATLEWFESCFEKFEGVHGRV